jgi:F-type H+-transporting ATPase subunit c
VNQIAKVLLIACGVVLLTAVPVLAADEGGAAGGAGGVSVGVGSAVDFSKYFGVGLTVIGAAYGIGKLAASAYEGMSRQPEVAGSIQTAMIIAAALIEGFTFFALVICMLF